ncbi:hypothetical protein [Vibrio parahaemolyticus]|uniref:hypothetical protein n=1 Tax=Vibrio parahaemolyticus TaxID=670 RepID=UPI001110B251|nr:hypothetical protein [Vibrio parahaemolyticus]TMX40858.1 hypothetical protein DA098_03235 [Vibrio parahaemolyticus]TMX79837.1 hypothetical protein DA094_04965 [Vibrio parahaemolyticus]
MSKHHVKTVHFSIEGAFVVKIAREKAVYESWKDAISMLTDSFVGMTLEIAISILKGDKTLTGYDNDIKLVDETPEERKRLTDEYIYQYQDVLKVGEQYYKPIYWMAPTRASNAYVNDQFQGGSFHYDQSMPSNVEIASFWIADVAQYHFSRHSRKDNFHMYIVAWEKVGKIPPLWFKDEIDPKVIIDRRIMDGTFSRIMELDNDSVRSRWQSYVSSYDDSNMPIVDVAAKALAPLAQEGFLEKLREQAKHNQMDAKERAFEIMRLRHEIWEQNGDDDYVVLCDVYKVPRKPLANWALCRSKGEHLAPHWRTVSDSGWKMYGDNPDHTDWVIGAGVDPNDIYDSKKDLNDAAYAWAYKYQTENTKGNLALLVALRKSQIESLIQHPNPQDIVSQDIVVIPDCSTKWIHVAKQVGKRGGIIITKTGGRMSHLVMNGEDYGVTILMHPEADKLFPKNCLVSIDPSAQTYRFPDKSVEEIMTRVLSGY